MRVRDPEAKQRRLLDAALTEFGERGLEGARIDALASRAGCSSGLVYTYFGSKDGLFDAVMEDISTQMVDQIPLTPEDLPEYAVRLYDAHAVNPDVGRFVSWYQLERREAGAASLAAELITDEKTGRIEAAQRAGILSSRLTPAEIVLAVQTIARTWFTLPAATLAALEPTGSDEARREIVRRTVAALLAAP